MPSMLLRKPHRSLLFIKSLLHARHRSNHFKHMQYFTYYFIYSSQAPCEVGPILIHDFTNGATEARVHVICQTAQNYMWHSSFQTQSCLHDSLCFYPLSWSWPLSSEAVYRTPHQWVDKAKESPEHSCWLGCLLRRPGWESCVHHQYCDFKWAPSSLDHTVSHF